MAREVEQSVEAMYVRENAVPMHSASRLVAIRTYLPTIAHQHLFGIFMSVAAFVQSHDSLKAGDCVYLKSPEKLPYMALVDWVGEMQIRCRWFYRYAELPAHLRKAVAVAVVRFSFRPTKI